jgi:hypothetical protein
MDRQDQVPHVNASRANQLAFSAEHALLNFLFQQFCFPPEEDGVEAANIKVNKMSGCTCRSATAAPDTDPE